MCIYELFKINPESSDMESTNIFIFDSLDPLFFLIQFRKNAVHVVDKHYPMETES